METSVDTGNTIRLFAAFSVLVHFQGHKNVIFQWFRLNRKEPVAPYQQLIASYQLLDRLEQLHLESFIDEAFTEQEILELREHLRKARNLSLQIEELSLPIQQSALTNPFAFLAQSKQTLYMLNQEDKDYDLPFLACGRYDLSQHEPIDEDLEEAHRLGLFYVKETLKALSIAAESDFDSADGRFSEAKLREIVARLRAEQGLEVNALLPRDPPSQPPQPDDMAYLLNTYLNDEHRPSEKW